MIRISHLSTALAMVAASAAGCTATADGSAGSASYGTPGTVVVSSGGGGGGAGGGPASTGPATAGAPNSGPPGQWSVAEREYWAALQTELNDYARQASEACGTPISAGYVYETFRGRMTDGGSYGLDAYTRSSCAAPVTAIRSMCVNSQTARSAIAGRIHRVECAWGASANALQSDTVRMTFNTTDNNASGYETNFTAWLRNSL